MTNHPPADPQGEYAGLTKEDLHAMLDDMLREADHLNTLIVSLQQRLRKMTYVGPKN